MLQMCGPGHRFLSCGTSDEPFFSSKYGNQWFPDPSQPLGWLPEQLCWEMLPGNGNKGLLWSHISLTCSRPGHSVKWPSSATGCISSQLPPPQPSAQECASSSRQPCWETLWSSVTKCGHTLSQGCLQTLYYVSQGPSELTNFQRNRTCLTHPL